MGGGGGSKQESSASSMPLWAEPYHKELLGRAAQFAYGQPYEAYSGQRISDFSPEEEAAFGVGRNMYETGDEYARPAASSVGKGVTRLDQMSPAQSAGGFTPQSYDFSKFDPNEYASPYQQAVTDIALKRAREDFDRQERDRRSQYSSYGASGGYNERLDDILGGQGQAMTLADIQAAGSQSGWDAGVDIWKGQQRADIEAAKMGQLDRQRMAELSLQSQEQNQRNLLNAARGYSGLAQTTAGLGRSAQDWQLAMQRNLGATGEMQRMQDQAYLDQAYADYRAQTDYPKTQMNWLQGILSGVPVGPGAITSPGPDRMSQAIGTGLGAAAIASGINQVGG